MANYVIRIARGATIIALFGAMAIAGTMTGVLFAYASDLPEISALDDYNPSTITRVLAANGDAIGEFAVQRRIVIGYDDISPTLREAIIPAEDADFNSHFGLNISRILITLMRDVFETVPSVLKESAYGVGCTTWEVVTHIVLPYTRVGVIGGIMLGLGRALGETMAVTFVIGNANYIDSSLFAAGNSIASTLANEFGEADPGLHLSSLFALGLVLFIITCIVLGLSRWLIVRGAVRQGK